MVKVRHDFFELTLAHLSVSDGDFSIVHQVKRTIEIELQTPEYINEVTVL